ncbi:Dephospho-CoA kinase [Marinobacterium sp. xm-d-579]|uniref:dephospho-CoA kinase n=1 Tax=Marinobacterium sp. xm-d-579 TaxID=2497734 RepID=UPI0015693EA0|nr:dephospho-CoA kinase [Marinobacterium sp. xm-d-579]NRP35549.1 Dephospho-CoA kinase [Marinobacterium sp. xm-d-579]
MPPFILGLTGGIASGKTAAADRLESLGATLVDTDLISREVVEPGQPALTQIEQHFGPEVIQDDGQLNRAALRERVFKDPNERQWLEALLHPLIRQRTLERALNADTPIAVVVVPLLFESGHYQEIDASLVIDVPVEVQRQRTLSRDGVSEAQVDSILAAQMDRQSRIDRADYVISNTGTLDELYSQVDALYHQLTTQQTT